MKIEAIFGGLLALFVIAIAAVAMFNFSSSSRNTPVERPVIGDRGSQSLLNNARSDGSQLCVCFDQGRATASEGFDVMSSQYRTGYEVCRSYGREFADAFTAGWNSKLSRNAATANCRSYRRGA